MNGAFDGPWLLPTLTDQSRQDAEHGQRDEQQQGQRDPRRPIQEVFSQVASHDTNASVSARVEASRTGWLEHFPTKWTPVRRQKMR
jgi:hypothetical protein